MKIRLFAIITYFIKFIFKKNYLPVIFASTRLSYRVLSSKVLTYQNIFSRPLFHLVSVRSVLFTIISLFSTYTLATITPTAFIVGGSDTEQEYPWMVALYQSDNYICGGVVISSHWVATAAHCVYDGIDDVSQYKIIIGESTHYPSTGLARKDGITVQSVKQAIINPNYVSDATDEDTVDYDYDIALIELTDGFYQSGPALTNATQFNNMPTGKALTVIGYGALSVDDEANSSDVIPDSLQQASLPYIPNDQCYWNEGGFLTDNMLCAGYYDDTTSIDACSGDSGSPLFSDLDGQLSLVGIVSWGASSCSGVPGVFTKISNLRSWILSQIDGLQVVQEGTASNDTTGVISVYHYGENNDVDDTLTIAELNFESDYSELFNLSDNCSGNLLYATDLSCDITFSLIESINSEYSYDANLTINTNSVESEKNYQLTFLATSDADEIIETNSNTTVTSAASLGFFTLLLLALLSVKRFLIKDNKISI